MHHFWKTCFRWRKSTSLSWFLATHLQPGKEHCCLLRCPTPSLDLDQPEYQPWCEAKWSMCIMPLLWANNWNPRETRGPWGELAEGRKATMRSFLSSKANVSWHAAIFKMLRGDMRGKLAPISSYPALIRCRSVACFRHPNFSMHYIPSGIPVLCWTYANEVSPKLQKSFIYHSCMAWCPTSKTDLILECQTCQTCLMKEFERKPLCVLGILRPMNMETNWMFPTDISWPTHHAIGEACSHLKLPGTDSLRLGGMQERKLENAFCASLLSNRPNFSIHYIPSGIPVLCWTHVRVCSFTCLPQHRLDFPITDVALEFFWWVMITNCVQYHNFSRRCCWSKTISFLLASFLKDMF